MPIAKMTHNHRRNALRWLDNKAAIYAHLYAKQRPEGVTEVWDDAERMARPKSWIRRTTLYRALEEPNG